MRNLKEIIENASVKVSKTENIEKNGKKITIYKVGSKKVVTSKAYTSLVPKSTYMNLKRITLPKSMGSHKFYLNFDKLDKDEVSFVMTLNAKAVFERRYVQTWLKAVKGFKSQLASHLSQEDREAFVSLLSSDFEGVKDNLLKVKKDDNSPITVW